MTSTIESPRAVQRPTRVRFVVVGLAVLLGMVTYLDRACIGTLEEHRRPDQRHVLPSAGNLPEESLRLEH
jgi:hypothetical protein